VPLTGVFVAQIDEPPGWWESQVEPFRFPPSVCSFPPVAGHPTPASRLWEYITGGVAERLYDREQMARLRFRWLDWGSLAVRMTRQEIQAFVAECHSAPDASDDAAWRQLRVCVESLPDGDHYALVRWESG
jgi:hypothetical protein